MIPLSVPHLAGNEWQYVKECLDTGWVSSVGSYVTKFEQMVAEFAGTKYGVACVNGTAALHISLRLCGVSHDDYVILPNITFIATANAVKYTNANPIFIDVDAETWQMDLDILEAFLQNDTYLYANQLYSKKNGRAIKAIMPVHVLGNMCDMSRLMQLAEQYHLKVIEDSTEALGSYWKGKHAGSFGNLGNFSFNGNKIISTGGGGVIVTDDEYLAKQAKHLTTQAKVSADEYIHDEIGYNYRLVNVLAAIGVAQMEQLSDFIAKKKYMFDFYTTHLQGVGDIRFQKMLPDVDANCWLITIQTNQMRPLLKYLNENGVQARPFWMPMNQLRMFHQDLYVNSKDISNQVYESCISIPSSVGVTDEQLQVVVKTIQQFYQNID